MGREMQINTKPFGSIMVEERQIITFPSGIFGFEQHTRFALLDASQAPFYWLQSVHAVNPAFLLINPYLFRPDYLLEIPDTDYEELGRPPQEEILVFAIVTVPERPEELTANLQGPLVINRKQRIAKQSIHRDGRWHTKHRILEESPQAVRTR